MTSIDGRAGVSVDRAALAKQERTIATTEEPSSLPEAAALRLPTDTFEIAADPGRHITLVPDSGRAFSSAELENAASLQSPSIFPVQDSLDASIVVRSGMLLPGTFGGPILDAGSEQFELLPANDEVAAQLARVTGESGAMQVEVRGTILQGFEGPVLRVTHIQKLPENPAVTRVGTLQPGSFGGPILHAGQERFEVVGATDAVRAELMRLVSESGGLPPMVEVTGKVEQGFEGAVLIASDVKALAPSAVTQHRA